MSGVGNIEKYENLDVSVQNLLRQAVNARDFAYAPYSKFKVGATILTEDGTIFTGCNVENASFGVGLCAERTAYAKAVSEGKTKFRSVAVITKLENDEFTAPCGACRQFISEFGNVKIYLASPNLDSVLVTSLDQLLPLKFTKFSCE